MNVDQVDVFVGGHGRFQVLPPMIENPLFANETEPGREQQVFVCHHFEKDFLGDPFHVVNFVWVTLNGKIRLGGNGVEKDVVNFVFSPRTIFLQRKVSQGCEVRMVRSLAKYNGVVQINEMQQITHLSAPWVTVSAAQ